MEYLVTTRPKHPVPPEIGAVLIDAMSAWIKQHTASGKIKTNWAFAGTGGGGGILSVDSAEELDTIMSGFPFGPFNDVQIEALVDLEKALANTRKAMQAMGGG